MRNDTYTSKKGPFVATTIVIFFLTLSAFNSIGFVPYYVDGSEPSFEHSSNDSRTVSAATHEALGPWNPETIPHYEPRTADTQQQRSVGDLPNGLPVTPERIIIHAIDLDLRIQNPASTNINDLDTALLNGPVRYPGSGRLGESGNMFIFGHSSSLAVVRNQMYKAFNRLPELKEGDTINIQGGGKEYIYRVNTVRLTDANEELVDLSPVGGARLTLTTCNTFGQKSERWIVEAEFVGAYTNGM